MAANRDLEVVFGDVASSQEKEVKANQDGTLETQALPPIELLSAYLRANLVKGKEEQVESAFSPDLIKKRNQEARDAAESQALPPSSKEIELARAAEEGFGTNSTVGYQWTRAVSADPELKRNYQALGRNYPAQRAFRQRWARQQVEVLQHQRLMTTTVSEVEGEKGNYMSLRALMEAEGGDQEAATNYAAKCTDLFAAGALCRGRPWVQWNDFTQRVEFLHMRHEVVFRFQKAWSEEVSMKVTTNTGNTKSSEKSSEEAASTPVKPPAQKRIRVDDPSKVAKGAPSETSVSTASGNSAKPGVDIGRKFRVAKERYDKAMSLYFSLTPAFEKEEWAWARAIDEPAIRELKMKLEGELGGHDFWQAFVCMEPTNLKKLFTNTGLQQHAPALDMRVLPLVEDLHARLAAVQLQQSARTKLRSSR